MSRSHSAMKREQDANAIDIIDLTGSPPRQTAPSQTRRPQTQQQHNSNRVNPKASSRNSLASKIQKHAPNPPINPAHIRKIILSSPPDVVNNVLLELCQLSPALSGAVVRSLSPHSKYAQDMTKGYGKRPLEPQIKPDPGFHVRSAPSQKRAQEEQRFRPNGHSGVTKSLPRSHSREQAGSSSLKRNFPRPSDYKDSSEDEFPFDLASFLGDSNQRRDGSSRPFSEINRHNLSSESVTSSKPKRNDTIQTETPRVKPEPSERARNDFPGFVKENTNPCKRCHKQVTSNDFSTCICHPGHPVRTPRGQTYDCCGSSVDSPGCSREFHDVA